ncbi:hypothetical protein PoB_005814600 [Plakobranchus ocellatus]|uniref:Uncharacterized protein n=1 Tax=Plakobranchus ocellatus TaxID=259542 RepID=A0AAV4CFS5_9GAST|nr:hypothetical protein PoB_005814600 [Plakobranchus ocellatus]
MFCSLRSSDINDIFYSPWSKPETWRGRSQWSTGRACPSVLRGSQWSREQVMEKTGPNLDWTPTPRARCCLKQLPDIRK